MNRRNFSKRLVGGAVGAGALVEGRQGASSSPSAVPYNLSVMLWTVFRELPFEKRMEKVVEAGYNQIELIGEYKKWSEEDFKRANAKRKELGITFDITAGLKHGAANPSDREGLLADVQNELKIMERIGCPALIIMSGNVVPGMSRDIQHQSCIDSLKRAAALVEGKQIDGKPIRLLLENIDPEENPKYYLTSVAEGFEIVRAVDHPQVRLLYDFFHEQISEGNLIEKLRKNIDYTGLVHIADVPGRHIPGTGEIHYDNIYKTLAELNYRHTVAMEFHPLGEGVEELRRAKEQALRAGRSA